VPSPTSTHIAGDASARCHRLHELPAPAWRRSVALLVAESQWWSERVGDHFEYGVDAGWMQQLGLPDEPHGLASCPLFDRRKAAARAVANADAGARRLLLDEPTGNLDQGQYPSRRVLARRLSTAAAGRAALGQSRLRRRSNASRSAAILLRQRQAAGEGAAMNVITLSPSDLAVAALLILALAGLSRRLRLGVERQLLVSAARSTIQLFLIGLVLKVLFDNVAAWSGWPCWRVMLAVAGREVMVRQKRRFVGWLGIRRRHPVDVRLVVHGDRDGACCW
jgi:hypothetical protein